MKIDYEKIKKITITQPDTGCESHRTYTITQTTRPSLRIEGISESGQLQMDLTRTKELREALGLMIDQMEVK